MEVELLHATRLLHHRLLLSIHSRLHAPKHLRLAHGLLHSLMHHLLLLHLSHHHLLLHQLLLLLLLQLQGVG